MRRKTSLNKLVLPIFIVFSVLLVNCSQNKTSNNQADGNDTGKKVAVEENFLRINQNLDNFTIRRAAEDIETFRLKKKPVYSIRQYSTESSAKDPKTRKNIGGKDFYELAYTEYLRDGRKRYKKYVYDHTQFIENYHYDSDFQNLLLLHRVEPDPTNERNYYYLLNYYPNRLLKEEIQYRTYKGTDFDVQGYTAYGVKKHKGDITFSINHIGYDSIPDPQELYTFSKLSLIKQKPQYQAKKQYLKWMGSAYQPVKTEGFVFEDRNVEFAYDDKGFVIAEVWEKAGELENKKEFSYNADYAERIQQNYQQLGTEPSSKQISRFNAQGDVIFEQTIEYTGNKLAPTIYEYVYDANDNWTARKKFRQESDGKKTLVQHDLRELTYFAADSKVRDIPFPKLAAQTAGVGASLQKAARQKQRGIKHFDEAQADGDYAEEITLQEAKDIKYFTPKYWQIKATAYGDLDKIAGDEAVAIYQTAIPDDLGFKQSLAIFKKKGSKWTLWHQTTSPVLATQAGGTMGNPFDGVTIANGAIIINHFGGSRQKWNYKHVYRFQQGDWYLIGASVNFGAPCDYLIKFDYNLSTGSAKASYQQEICADATKPKAPAKHWTESFKLKEALPKMDDFVPGNTMIEVPNVGEEIYY